MFEPHHQFRNCQRLRTLIRTFRDNNNVQEPLWNAHNTYHYTLIHKLKSTKYYAEELDFILSNTLAENIFSASGSFLFTVNKSLDGFFHCGGGALDILAREVLTYFGIELPSNVYFQTARNELTQHRPNDHIINCLRDPTWKADFTNYRNACTHELLIAGSFLINVTTYGGTQTEKIILPLPDDPRSDPSNRTYRRYPDVLCYCTTTLKRILTLVNVVYGKLADRMSQTNRLPL